MTNGSLRTAPADRRDVARRAALLMLAATCVLLNPACGPTRRRIPAPGGPKVLTVPAIERMVQMGTQPSVILDEMQRSGTVYNLTTQQMKDLRAVGMPPSLIGQMQLTYQHALQRRPDLATSGSSWTQIDGYWYGGLPFGWPREWVQ